MGLIIISTTIFETDITPQRPHMPYLIGRHRSNRLCQQRRFFNHLRRTGNICKRHQGIDMQITFRADPRGFDIQSFETDNDFGTYQALFHAGKKIGAACRQTGIRTMSAEQLCGFFYGCRTKVFKFRKQHRCHNQVPSSPDKRLS